MSATVTSDGRGHCSPAGVTAGIGVITNIEGTVLTEDDRRLLQSPVVSGLILFSRNFTDTDQLRTLSASVKALRPDLALFVDQEGGRVQRFKEGFTRLPPMQSLEPLWRDSPQLVLQCSRNLGWLMAWELGCCGVDTSFAPVLDVERGISRVIGDRAFGSDPARVALLAQAFVTGMALMGMKAVGKHFPGHGAIEADSHLEFPIDRRSLAQLDYDMRPFRHLINAGVLPGVMPAHVLYPSLDGQHTAGFSFRWMTLLRDALGFDGVVFSDDLSMAGAAQYGDYSVRAELAVKAGCQALVTCNDRAGAWEVVHAVEAMIARSPSSSSAGSGVASSSGYTPLSLSGWCRKSPAYFKQQQEHADSIRAELMTAGLIQTDSR